MKIKKALTQKTIWKKTALCAAIMVTAFLFGGFESQAAEGKVTAGTAKIRAEANTDSEVVGSTVKGKTIDIIEAVKDSAGTVWYKVPIENGQYGYIRGDLVETAETITPKESTGSASSTTGSEENTEKPAATVPTAIGEQKAVISTESVIIRSGASKQHDRVSSLPNGTAITLIGEANDSAGNKWYQITCSYNNKNIEGYVRSDLISIGGSAEQTGGSSTEGESQEQPAEGTENTEGAEGEAAEGAEGENPEGAEGTDAPEEEPVTPEEEHKDYEIVYAQNDETGEYEYYLYDNINSTRQKLSDLQNVVSTANANNDKLLGQIKNGKIIIIVLAVIIVLLVVTVTVLLFKIRDLYYESYDDEEEEEEEEPVVVRKKAVRRYEEEEEEPAPVRRKRPAPQSQPQQQSRSGGQARSQQQARPQTKQGQQRPAQSAGGQQRKRPAGEAPLHAAEERPQTKRPASRKAQNFLVDDDEFEFEFLNMDDKDI